MLLNIFDNCLNILGRSLLITGLEIKKKPVYFFDPYGCISKNHLSLKACQMSEMKISIFFY